MCKHMNTSVKSNSFIYSNMIPPNIWYNKEQGITRSSSNYNSDRCKPSEQKPNELVQQLEQNFCNCDSRPTVECEMKSKCAYKTTHCSNPNDYEMIPDFASMPTCVIFPQYSDSPSWPLWSDGDVYYMPQVISPSSPLDSGLSSQSVASSPTLEAEASLNAKRIPKCGSPVPLATIRENQCSCSTNSFLNCNALSPPIRSDSGRSSPYTYSSTVRLTDLSEVENTGFRYNSPILPEHPSMLPYYLDNRRYSMSGIYINPPRKKHNQPNDTRCKKKNYVKKSNSKKLYQGFDSSNSKDFSYATNGIYCDKVHTHDLGTQYFESTNQSNTGTEVSEQTHQKEWGHTSRPVPLSNEDIFTTYDNNNYMTNKEKRNTEKAIYELEEMYNQLALQDGDLLDRADRRDLTTQMQKSIPKHCGLTRSVSDSFYEVLSTNYKNPFKAPTRAPPLRRSGIPDPITDDMALRKQQKANCSSQQEGKNTSTYMLYSSHFTPSLPIRDTILTRNKPDIEHDDFSFRRYFQASSVKSDTKQPPFGIPLQPNSPQSLFSDYLHIVPSSLPPPLCHPRGNPDLVRDDLAFRSWRKDNPERALYDSYALFYKKKEYVK